MAWTAPQFKILSVKMCTERRDKLNGKEMPSASWWSQDKFEWSNWIALSASKVRACVCVCVVTLIRPFTQFHSFRYSSFFIFYLYEAHYLILFHFIFHIYRNAAHFFLLFFFRILQSKWKRKKSVQQNAY